jgi:hypothetical protein
MERLKIKKREDFRSVYLAYIVILEIVHVRGEDLRGQGKELHRMTKNRRRPKN